MNLSVDRFLSTEGVSATLDWNTNTPLLKALHLANGTLRLYDSVINFDDYVNLQMDAANFISGSGAIRSPNGVIFGIGHITARNATLDANHGTLEIDARVLPPGQLWSGAESGTSENLIFDIDSMSMGPARLKFSNSVTTSPIAINNENQTLEVSARGNLTLTAAEKITNGKIVMSGGTLLDTYGVTVGTGATLSGYGTVSADLAGAGVIKASGGVLSLAGSVASSLGLAIDTSSASVLRLTGTSTHGAIAINDAHQTLEVGAGGNLTLTTAESITNGTIKMSGGTLADVAGLTIGAGASLQGFGTVTAATGGPGTILATGGTLKLTAALDGATASDIHIGDGAVLKLDGTVGSSTVSPTITFDDGAGTLDLGGGSLPGFHATLVGFGAGDTIDVAGAASAVLDGSGQVATVYDGANVALGTLHFASSWLGEGLAVTGGAIGVVTGSGSGNDLILGTAGDDTINSGAGNDLIKGMDGNDTLNGGNANDTLYGGAGDDILKGGSGADSMYGGTGNDTHYVDNAGDRVFEAAGEGNDLVYSSASWTMAAGQEIETLCANGNASNGGVAFFGNEFDNSLIGGIGNDFLNGGAGNDVLNGGAGNDTLMGSLGRDTFAFSSALGATNIDTVNDFVNGTDTLQLDHTVFGGLALGPLTSAAFAIGSATGSGPQIVYDQTTGALSYDSNGAGAGGMTQFATLTGAPTLDYSSIIII